MTTNPNSSLAGISDGELMARYKALTFTCLIGMVMSIGLFVHLISSNMDDIKQRFIADAKLRELRFVEEWNEIKLSMQLMEQFFLASNNVTPEEFSTFSRPLLAQNFTAFSMAYQGQNATTVTENEDVRKALDAWLSKNNISDLEIRNVQLLSRQEGFVNSVLLLERMKQGNGEGVLIGAKLNLSRFMASILNEFAGRVQVHIFVGDKSDLLFDSNTNVSLSRLFSHTKDIEVFNQTLRLSFTPVQTNVFSAVGAKAWGALICGLLITVGIGAFLFVLIGRNVRIDQYAAHLQRSEKRLQLILDNAGEGVFGVNLQGHTTFCNKAAVDMLGYAAEEMLGKSQHDLIHHHYADGSEYKREDCNIYKAFKDGKEHSEDKEVFWKKDGTPVCVEYTSRPVRDDDGRIAGAVVVFRDISERRVAEEEKGRYMRELERSNQDLNDFAYIASHDLKEPLRGLHNHAAFLLEDYEDILDDDGVRRLHRFGHLTQRMEALINDLLYFSRIGRQDLAVQETDIAGVIHDITDMMAGTIAEKQVRVNIVGNLPHIQCDKTRVTELFRNLITNAIKYNDKEHKRVEIGFLNSREHEGVLHEHVFFVQDNGVGIEKEFFGDVFRIFKRLQKDTGDGGTGSGLTFVKKIVERHAGDIWIESTMQRGTTFYFTLKGSIYEQQPKAA